MARKRLFRQIYLHYLFIIVLSMTLSMILVSWTLRDFYTGQVKEDLEARALLVEKQIREPLARSHEELDNLCRHLGDRSHTRITIILPSGKVVADSRKNPAEMDNHADRPEIRTAFGGKVGSRVRYSHTLQKMMVYVAVPAWERENILCAVRASMPLATVGQALEEVQGRILLFVFLVALAAMGISLVFSRKISRPMEEMKQGAQRFALGDLQSRLHVPDSEEMGGLAETLNDMAAQLDERIRTITRQRREQEAILASMVEGVIAVNAGEKIISINQAACGMLGLRAEQVQGKSVQEAVRNATLHALVASTLSGRGEEAGGKAILETSTDRFLQANGAILRDVGGERIGAVIVLNDITQLRKLENHRREFVANVSHELRTPITSIKGFVETLRDGALQSTEDAERFLGIIARQVDQLNAIIEDLLVLSRIEQNGERSGFNLEPTKVRDVLESAIEVCSTRAVEKDISIGLSCNHGLTGQLHFPLLTQAVVNLLDNAINFSNTGSAVQVEAGEEAGGLFIRVRDQGSGIPEEHISRLTERFYRVDKARSRKMGGTGLGLAIVKHIVQSHGGTLSIESTLGKGSTFTLRLPLRIHPPRSEPAE
jgi:two-component system phosphate regulon sensor histidine kinase PhoR